MELRRKEQLIQRQTERLQAWQSTLSRTSHSGSSGAVGSPAGSSTATPQSGSSVGLPTPGTPQQSTPQLQQSAGRMPPITSGLSQGPLAYLEQTTSSIGLPGRGSS